jgi:predicted dinucleotide-binding enzyme
MGLVGKLGFEPVDAGPLKNARLLEPLRSAKQTIRSAQLATMKWS